MRSNEVFILPSRNSSVVKKEHSISQSATVPSTLIASFTLKLRGYLLRINKVSVPTL